MKSHMLSSKDISHFPIAMSPGTCGFESPQLYIWYRASDLTLSTLRLFNSL